MILTFLIILVLLLSAKKILRAFGPLGLFSAIFIGAVYNIATWASAIGISFADFLHHGCVGLLLLVLFGRMMGWHGRAKCHGANTR